MELPPPLVVRLQVDEVFRIEETGGIGAIIRPSDLRDHFRDLGKPGEGEASLIHDADALARSGAGGQGTARPDGAFVEVGKNSEPIRPLHTKPNVASTTARPPARVNARCRRVH